MAKCQYYKLIGKRNVNVKLKPGILPHIFHCQTDYSIVKPTTSRGAFEKRKRLEYITEAIKGHEKNTKLEKEESLDSQNNANVLKLGVVVTSAKKDKCVQGNIKTKKSQNLLSAALKIEN